MTEPTVGAWVWASGSHVWNGNIGTLMPKPMNMPANTQSCDALAMPSPWNSVRSRMSKVCSWLRKNSARKLMIISAEPNSV